MFPISISKSGLRSVATALALGLLAPLQTLAQSWTGWVYSETGRTPVVGAKVATRDGNQALTDAKGMFVMSVPSIGVALPTARQGWNAGSQSIFAYVDHAEPIQVEVVDLKGRVLSRPVDGIVPVGNWQWSPMQGIGGSAPVVVRYLRNGRAQSWMALPSLASAHPQLPKLAARSAAIALDSLDVSASGFLAKTVWASLSETVLDTIWLKSTAGVQFAIRWTIEPASIASVTLSGDTTVNYGETRNLQLSYDHVLWKLDSLRLNNSLLQARDTFTFAAMTQNKSLNFWLSQNYTLPGNGYYRFVGHTNYTSQPNLVNLLFQVLDSAGYGVTALDTANFATPLVDGLTGTSESWFRIQKSGEVKYSYRFALLLDNSSSLNPVDLEKLKSAAAKVVDNMFAGQQIAVWKVSGTAPTLVQDYTDDKILLKKNIAAILPAEITGTPLFLAVQTGVTSLGAYYTPDSVRQGSVLLFTDGRNEGTSVTMAQAINTRGATPVYGILLANDPANNALNHKSLDSLQNMGGSIAIDNADRLEAAMLNIQERNLRYSKSFYRLVYATSALGNSNDHTINVSLKANQNHGSDSALTKSFNSSGLVAKIAPVVTQVVPTWGTGAGLTVGDTLHVAYKFQNINGTSDKSILTGAYTVSDSSRIQWYNAAGIIGKGPSLVVKPSHLSSQIRVEILPLAGRVYNFTGALVSRDTGLVAKAWLPYLVSAPNDTVVKTTSLRADWVFASNSTLQSVKVDGIARTLVANELVLNMTLTSDTMTHVLRAIDQYGNPLVQQFTTILGMVKPVVIDPAAGTYTSTQSVTLTNATPGASIFYTTNGTTPDTNSIRYTAPIAVTANQTLRAIAIKSGWASSDTVRAVYVINVVAKPTNNVASGTYTSARSVTLTTATVGARIFYTVDGTIPDTNSTLYAGPIAVSTSQTLKYISVKSGWAGTPVDSASYIITGTMAAPTFGVAAGSYPGVQSVTLNSTDPNARIYYTTNGAVPDTNSTRYTSAITVDSSKTIKAIATKATWLNSAVATAIYTINIATKPVFSLASGAYTSSQPLTLTTTTVGASIRYTTNGSTPDSTSTLYSTPLTIASNQTVKAIALKAGWGNSPIDSGVYAINIAAIPVPSVLGGAYPGVQSIALSSATSDASIYYTLDGTTPTIASTLYNTPIAVNASLTLKAIAIKALWANSAVATVVYTINIAAKPSFSVPSGTYTTSQTLTLTTTTVGASIRYTTNGSTPDSTSSLYSTPLTIVSNQAVKAITLKVGWGNSSIDSGVYVMNIAAVPVFSVLGGAYPSAQFVALSTATSDAGIYYTLDGTTPTIASTLYTSPIAVNASLTLKAIAIKALWANSAVVTGVYAINIASKPAFSLASGTYTAIQPLSLSTSTVGASIRYTTNGTIPDSTSTLFTSVITIANIQTVKAIAIKSGWGNSPIDSATYVMRAVKPTFSLAAGSFSNSQSVALATSTPGARIFYTMDGTSPDTNSLKYSAPILVSSSQKIKAMAVLAGWINSAVDSSVYEIGGWRYGITYGSVIDVAGRSYKTIQIGSQTWMAENLNYRGLDADTGSCIGNSVDSCAKYGRLYTWATAMHGASSSTISPSGVQGICPTAWHLPSDVEWDTLFVAVGGNAVAGKNLKSILGWDAPGNGTDQYGFHAIPGGLRVGPNTTAVGNNASFWSTSEGDALNARYIALSWAIDYPARSSVQKSLGSSVRCIQN